MTVSRNNRSSAFARRVSALAAFAGASLFGAQAQQAGLPAAPAGAEPVVQIASLNPVQPLDLASSAGVNYSSSSSSSLDGVDASAADHLTLSADAENKLQPPPRRRYGRPRYQDSSHNPDGSNKYAFFAGAGFTLPTADTYHYYNTSWGFQVGAGRNFNKNLGVMVQFDWDEFGLNSATLTNYNNVSYNACVLQLGTGAGCSSIAGLDGNNHIWSFTLSPVYNFHQGDKAGAYVTAGVGFYHKVTNFTAPEVGLYYDPYYGPIEYQANAVIDHYTSNAPGFNAGLGFTYKPSRFANERFYVEGRYVFVDNSQRYGASANSSSSFLATYAGTNYFPANSNRTTYIPIKVGLRF